jgi:hypothetical protein
MQRLSHAPGQFRVPAKMKVHMAISGNDYKTWLVTAFAVAAVYDKSRVVLFKAQGCVGIGSCSASGVTLPSGMWNA